MATDQPIRYRALFGGPEFRALFAAQSVSVVGDQFARVALSVLVFLVPPLALYGVAVLLPIVQ